MSKKTIGTMTAILVLMSVLLGVTFYSAIAAPPPNDEIENAVEILALPFSDTLDVSEASYNPSDPWGNCNYYGYQDYTVWYSLTPTEDQKIEATTSGSNYDTTLNVYYGTPGNLIPVTCSAYGSLVAFNASAGTTYYFMIAAMNPGGPYPYPAPGSRTLVFNVQALVPPDNDDFQNAADIAEIPFEDRQNLATATVEAGEPVPSCVSWSTPTESVWYRYTPTESSLVTHKVQDGYSSFVGVYTGDTLDNLAEFNCSNDMWMPTILSLEANTTYHFQVGSLYSYGGWVTFELEPAHDVAITKFKVPNSAKAGQTRQISVGIKNVQQPETVQVELYKSSVFGYTYIGTLNGYVPVRTGNRTTPFDFSYTFTEEDARLGKVTFRAQVTILGEYDALPADNEAISSPTTVN